MDDKSQNYRIMAQGVLALLTRTRPEWEARYAKLLPDYETLQQALAEVDTQAQARSSTGTAGYTSAKDAAETAALDAALVVVNGLRTLQLDTPRPALAKVAAYSPSALTKLRDQAQADALIEIGTVAAPLAAELAAELITADQLTRQRDTAAAFAAMVGVARTQTVAGAAARRQALDHLAEARAALERLDVRMPNLRPFLPELVAQYEQQRRVIDAGS
ncbi:hypothetical protein [Hymenobacter psychrophilus]|uniref:Uncharacterized protein n=1 Tax=Hymenobacter psychrophilus TaxID=651662 RepID=A0A1H3I1I1_9BACT|nr:hypothetical protein [Hymenobacter psychrophilus]SDY21577.1 hypothetical protein SAMN04488069_106245 [Hymenobacter psychrophilus]